jgi:hypothetical protein
MNKYTPVKSESSCFRSKHCNYKPSNCPGAQRNPNHSSRHPHSVPRHTHQSGPAGSAAASAVPPLLQPPALPALLLLLQLLLPSWPPPPASGAPQHQCQHPTATPATHDTHTFLISAHQHGAESVDDSVSTLNGDTYAHDTHMGGIAAQVPRGAVCNYVDCLLEQQRL